MSAVLVSSLCALTCWACSILLLRNYRARPGQVLLWTALAFCIFGISNVLLCVDRLILPEMDLGLLRQGVTLLGIACMLRGLVWEGTR